MSIKVLTESNFDGLFLATLLAVEQGRDEVDVKFVDGLTTGYSVARTILAVERRPVAVVVDARSPEPEAALDRKSRAEEVLDDAAGGVPFRVVVARPELAILFFERPGLIERVFGQVDAHTLELAELSPRRAIGKLSPAESYDAARYRILRELDDADVQALRESELVRDLRDFIASHPSDTRYTAVSRA